MTLYENVEYLEDVGRVAGADLPWEKLEGRRVLVSGATGLLGSFLVDVLLTRREMGLDLSVLALGRDRNRALARFSRWRGNAGLVFRPCDVNHPLESGDPGRVDFAAHLASNTHPVQYATDPIGTIMTNVVGLGNLLEFAASRGCSRFVFGSSNEIYGENRGDVEYFDESYCGYIDCNTLRAGYPESKRCGEALCQAYRKQRGLDCVIARFTRSYGPTMRPGDTKAISQFIRRGTAGEDIVLKSAGTQLYSYTYVADAVSGFLTALLKGADGQAYNIADPGSDLTLRELAGIIAGYAGTRVVFELPDAIEAAGYSRATRALLDGGRLKALGWQPRYGIREGVERTIRILRSLEDGAK